MSKQQFKSLLFLLIILILVIIGVTTLTGCNQSQYDAIQAGNQQLQAQLDQQDQYLAQLDGLIADTRAQLDSLDLSDEDRAAAEENMEKLEAARDAVNSNIAGVSARIAEISEAIANAPTPEEMAAVILGEGGAAAAPFAGPYAPWVLLGSNALAAILTGFATYKRTRASTARKIVVPIELARERSEESATTIVVDRADVTKGHKFAGVTELIKDLTT